MKKLYFAIPAILLIGIISVFVFVKPIATYALHHAGFPEASVDSVSVGLSGTTITGLKLDQGRDVIGKIELYATLDDILNKQLGKVVMSDATLVYPFTALTTSDGGTGKAFVLNLFTREAAFNNIKVTAATDQGEASLIINGGMQDQADKYAIVANIEGKAPFAEATGKTTINIQKADMQAKAHTEIFEARVNLPDFDIKRASGWLEADVFPGTSNAPVINAQLSAGSVKAYGLPLQGTTFSIATTAQKIEAVLTGSAINNAGEINANVKLDRTAPDLDKLTANINAKLQNLEALGLADMTGEGSIDAVLTGEKGRAAAPADLQSWKNLKGLAAVTAKNLSMPGLVHHAVASGSLELAYNPAQSVLDLKTYDGPVTFKGVIPALGANSVLLAVPQASLAWANTSKALHADIAGADVVASGYTLKKINANLTALLQSAPQLDGTLDIGEVQIDQNPAYVIPFGIKAMFAPQKNSTTATTFKSAVSSSNGLLYVKAQGSHDMATNKGSADIDMPPVSLVQGVNSLSSLFPISAQFVEDAFGTIGGNVELAWFKEGQSMRTASAGGLYLKNFNFTYGSTVFENVSTVLQLDRLTPPVFNKQTVSIGALNVGMPLTDGVLVVSMDQNGNLTQHSGTFNLAGGTLSASAFTLPLSTLSTSLTLSATGIDVPSLFSIAPLEGLEATGTIGGTLPIRIADGNAYVENGVLQTETNGQIKYSEDQLPAFLRDSTQSQIINLRSALTSFNYDSLKMTLNGDLSKNQKIALEIKGRNPLFYNGRPVNFNLNVEGPLQSVLKYKPGNSTIPDNIKKQLEEFEKQHAP